MAVKRPYDGRAGRREAVVGPEEASGPGRRPTLRDVSVMAGVSMRTVSRVVSGEGYASAEVAERVRAAVERVGYVPDPVAVTLRRGKGQTRAVAVVVEDVANPFSAMLHRAVVDTMRAHGVVTLSASYDKDPGGERDAVMAFASRRVDGVILMPTTADHRWLDEIREAGTHVVLVDRPVPGLKADVVMSDHRAGAASAVAHLLSRGHRRVAFLADRPSVHSASERLAGYQQALNDAGVGRDEQLVRMGLCDSAAAKHAVVDLLTGAAPPTALLTGQNLLTIGAVQALRHLGMQHLVALVGFDDIPGGDLLDPGVTVLAQSPEGIGASAARRLLNRIQGDHSPAGPVILPTQLLPRGSGEIAKPRTD